MSARVAVLVVGAGPVGLTVACHLRRLGLDVRIVDKRSGRSVHSKAIGLQYRVSEVLARLGVIDRFVAVGGSPTTVNLYADRKRLVTMRFSAPTGVSGRDAFQPRAILIPQSKTEEILAEYLSELGGVVEWQTELVGYSQHAEGVTARLLRRETSFDVAADWLVSCEGAHSVARRLAGIAFEGKTYPLAFAMADVRMTGSLPHDENHVWLHRDGSLAALPLPDRDTWRLFVEVTRQADHLTGAPSLDDIKTYIHERAPDMDATIVGEPLWLSDFRISCRIASRMHDGRVFLAGDAAHIHSPTGGQGITTGMQDAVNLAWKLDRVTRGAPRALLDTYGEERLPHAAEVLAETDRTTTLLFAPTVALRMLRDLVVLPVLRNAWVQRRMFGKFSQLHVHYRGSSLSYERVRGWRRRRIRAGDRVPDVVFTRHGTAGRTSLFQLMQPLRPVVIFNGLADPAGLCTRLQQLDINAYALSGSAEASDGHALIDVHGDFRMLFGLERDFLCLIRPDGHVGLLLAPLSVADLVRYLLRICDPITVRHVLGSWP